MNGYQPDFWHWWILALALIIAETLLPGTFFLWMGVSALVLGGLAWLIPTMGWEIQLMLFAVLSLVSIVGWRMWQRKNPDESDHPMLNRRAEQY
ncbi:MAG: NfeD family protein, partial [Sedimenticolaceae bacterium]